MMGKNLNECKGHHKDLKCIKTQCRKRFLGAVVPTKKPEEEKTRTW